MIIKERTITELAVNEESIVYGFAIETLDILRLQEMGIIKGEKVKIIRKGISGSNMEVKVKGYHLSIRNNEASLILIKG